MFTLTRPCVAGTRRSRILFASLALALLPPCQAMGQDSDALKWSITPYLWASDINVDLAFRGNPIGGETVEFSDLLDVLESSVMLHLEGGKGHWSVFGDLTYLETSDTDVRQLLTVDTDSEQLFFDAAVAWWPQGVGSAFNLIGGVRYTDFDDRYRFSAMDTLATERRRSSDYTDMLLGLRYRIDFNDRWALLTRADGSFGDTEGTWLLRANVAWTVGKRRMNQVLFGYQVKDAEYDDGDIQADYHIQGLMAGFSFRF